MSQNTGIKLAAILKGSRGKSSIADICWKYGVNKSVFYRWHNKRFKNQASFLRNIEGFGLILKLRLGMKTSAKKVYSSTRKHNFSCKVKEHKTKRGYLIAVNLGQTSLSSSGNGHDKESRYPD